MAKKHIDIVSAYELRDLAQQAVINSRAKVKITYPHKLGNLIRVEFEDIKDLFNFAMAWGVLNWQLNPDLRQALRAVAECSFFICSNCRVIGKEKRHKLFINLCQNCGKDYQIKQDEETAKFWQAFDLRNLPKIREPVEEDIKPIEKPKEKLISPIKIKSR